MPVLWMLLLAAAAFVPCATADGPTSLPVIGASDTQVLGSSSVTSLTVTDGLQVSPLPGERQIVIDSRGPILISGSIRVDDATLPGSDGVDLILRSLESIVVEPSGQIIGSNGAPGASAQSDNPSDLAQGGAGGHGGSILLEAPTISALNLVPGGGGAGGSAIGLNGASASGGAGGDGGFAWLATPSSTTILSLGTAGKGGDARTDGNAGIGPEKGAKGADMDRWGGAGVRGYDGYQGSSGFLCSNGGDGTTGGEGATAGAAAGGAGGIGVYGGDGGHGFSSGGNGGDGGDGGNAGTATLGSCAGGDGGPGGLGGAGGAAKGGDAGWGPAGCGNGGAASSNGGQGGIGGYGGDGSPHGKDGASGPAGAGGTEAPGNSNCTPPIPVVSCLLVNAFAGTGSPSDCGIAVVIACDSDLCGFIDGCLFAESDCVPCIEVAVLDQSVDSCHPELPRKPFELWFTIQPLDCRNFQVTFTFLHVGSAGDEDVIAEACSIAQVAALKSAPTTTAPPSP
jgi:hypothetical protein